MKPGNYTARDLFCKKFKLIKFFTVIALSISYQVLAVDLPQKPVISYYFPRAISESDTTNTFSTSNIVDAPHGAWTDSLRSHWRSQGKIILNRPAFDYTATYSQNELNTLLENNISLYDGISIDELVAHQMDSTQINVFINALSHIKSNYPEKIIIVYSATAWDSNDNLLVSCMSGLEAYADLLVEEIYLNESYGFNQNWLYPYMRTRINALKNCGSSNVLGMTTIILGLYSPCMDRSDINIADHIATQMQYIKNDSLLSQTQGTAVYTPLYGTNYELRMINQAVIDNVLQCVYLRFDEASGSTAEDTSSSANNGTLTNFSTPGCWVSGKSGNALEFDGNNDFVNCGSDSSLECDEFTYAAWIKPYSTSHQYQLIIGKNSIWAKGFFISYEDLRGYVAQSSSSASAIKYATISENTWQHVAMTYKDNEVKLYLNGQLLSASTNTGSGEVTSTAGSSLLISNSSYPFDGLMDDVKIYTRALGDDEINNIYNSTPLQLRFRFDESSGSSTSNDATNLNNDGSLINFSTASCWVTGNSGNALEFDGNNDYVDCGSDSSLECSEFTYAAWIKPYSISRQYQLIIGKNSIWSKGFFISYGDLRAYVAQDNSSASATKYAAITEDTWQHVAMTYANNEIKLYLNGQLLSASATTGSGEVVSTASNNLLISNTSYPFGGLIDDVKVYSRALDADEINNIYQQY